MTEVELYRATMRDFNQLMTLMKVRAPRLSYFRGYLESEEVKVDKDATHTLIENLKDMCTLQEEIP